MSRCDAMTAVDLVRFAGYMSLRTHSGVCSAMRLLRVATRLESCGRRDSDDMRDLSLREGHVKKGFPMLALKDR